MKVTHLRAFLAEEQKRRSAVASQARTTAALKCFFRFLVEEERLLRDPFLPLRTPKNASHFQTSSSPPRSRPGFRHYVDAAGVNERKRVTPHTLRHVFASELLHAGANLRQIQDLLGHKHLDSTQRYTRVNARELRGAIKRLRWVG